MLNIAGLNQYHGESHTLRDVAFDIDVGSCTCVLGRNGVGKTSLLESIMGLLPVKSGQILFNGVDLAKRPAEARATSGIGYVPQGRQIFPLLTVEENIRTGLFASRQASKWGSEKPSKKIPELIFQLFPVLHSMRGRRGGDLSGGQQQQLAFARALVLEPELLLLDEPTEGIQPNIVDEIGDVINRLNRELNITVLLVEQKLPFARRIGNSYLLIDRGELVSEGSMQELGEDTVRQYLTV